MAKTATVTKKPKIRETWGESLATEGLKAALAKGGLRTIPIEFTPRKQEDGTPFWDGNVGDLHFSVWQDSKEEGGGYFLIWQVLPVSHDRFPSLEACADAVEVCVLNHLSSFLVKK
jgi:hypothetical protein